MIKKELKTIIKKHTGINLNDPETVKCRKRQFVEIRGIYYKILQDYTKFTLTHIGDDMGKTHATVLHAIKHFDHWMEYDQALKTMYYAVLNDFKEYLGVNKLEGRLSHNFEDLLDNYARLKKEYEDLKERITQNVD